MKCHHHPDITATATAKLPGSTPPYTRRVPLCTRCSEDIERLGVPTTQLEDLDAVLQRMFESGDARMNEDGVTFTLTPQGIEHARAVLMLLGVDPDNPTEVDLAVQRLAAPRN